MDRLLEGLALASGSLCIVGWYFATRINMARGDKLALAVAIVSEHASEQKKLNRDFVKALADTLHGATNTSQFEVIGIQPSYSRKIRDNQEAHLVCRKARAHFLVFGDIRVRKHQGDHYVLSLKAMLIHRPIAQNVSDIFSRERDAVLPTRVNIPATDELLGFEVTSNWLSESAKYVLRVAAMLSDDIVLATSLFQDLHTNKRLKSVSGIPGIKELTRKLPIRLAECYMAASTTAF